MSRRECCWGYMSIYENRPEKLAHLPQKKLPQLYLVVQETAPLNDSSYIVKVNIEATY